MSSVWANTIYQDVTPNQTITNMGKARCRNGASLSHPFITTAFYLHMCRMSWVAFDLHSVFGLQRWDLGACTIGRTPTHPHDAALQPYLPQLHPTSRCLRLLVSAPPTLLIHTTPYLSRLYYPDSLHHEPSSSIRADRLLGKRCLSSS